MAYSVLRAQMQTPPYQALMLEWLDN